MDRTGSLPVLTSGALRPRSTSLFFVTLFLLMSLRCMDGQVRGREPEQIIPVWSAIPRIMECQRLPVTMALDCVLVRFMPSVRFSRTRDNQLTVSGPDPARAVWVQAIGGNASEYASDIAAAPSVTGMPVNYFCINLGPALSGSGAAVLLFDARIRLADDSTIRVTGHFASGPSLITQLSAAVGWPGTYTGAAAPPGTVHLYGIGPGCRSFPAISFEPVTDGNSNFVVEDVYVFVSIP